MTSMALVPAALGNGVRVDGAHDGVEVRDRVVRYDDSSVVETWTEVVNTGDGPVVVQRLDSLVADLAPGDHELSYFTSGWGEEFGPVDIPLRTPTVLQSLDGRSSRSIHPWFALRAPDGSVQLVTVAWSGNWVFRFDGDTERGFRITGGLHDEGFAKTLGPGESVAGPRVVVVTGTDLDAATVDLARVGLQHWYARNDLSDRLPLEWNHWWSYEDHEIDEKVFRANVDAAQHLGIEVCTLDAGWFGPSDPGTHWVDYRGDWHLVNTTRFPSGLRDLADYVHGKGMAFGLWCEIEALGPKAALARERPELVATSATASRSGTSASGAPRRRSWAYDTLARLVDEYGADWIKLDFNLDPGLGCDRTDHGHGAGDGLFEHYTGYYDVLDRAARPHPAVVLENCSSGGLRIDLGMLRQDAPDVPQRPRLARARPAAAVGCLDDAASEPAAALGLVGVGRRASAADVRPGLGHPHGRPAGLLPPDRHGRRVRAVLAAAGPARLGGRAAARPARGLRRDHPPVRGRGRPAPVDRSAAADGQGDRWAAFQYTLAETDEHLVFAFRLPGGEPARTIRLAGLAPSTAYVPPGRRRAARRRKRRRDGWRAGLGAGDRRDPAGASRGRLRAASRPPGPTSGTSKVKIEASTSSTSRCPRSSTSATAARTCCSSASRAGGHVGWGECEAGAAA